MYDVEKLLSIVCDALDAEDELRRYNLKVRRQRGLQPGDSLWVPSLDGETAYRLGELCERCNCCWGMLSDICAMLDIDWALLITVVKSMRRKERHNGRCKVDPIVKTKISTKIR